ncbi:MAG TPA: signal peptidase I [Candidatus Dormibacteraeota bacterium]
MQTPEQATPTAKARGRGILTEVAEVLLLALALYLVINFAIQTVHVIGSSMLSTVVDQDYLIATKVDYRLHPPQRGDIIIMRDPYDSNRDFIKRVIAVPGDRILIRGGQVFLNGHLLREPYINSEPWTENADWPLGPTGDPQGVLLNTDEFFVMGDNRNHSSDSRVFGRVRRDQIEARAWLRVLPLPRFGPVDTAKPEVTTQTLPSQAA